MTDLMTGHCLCGAVTIRVSDSDRTLGACHCRMCQRWSGALFVCFAASPDAVTVEGEVARYQSSHFAERAFCPVCGSHLWMRDTDRTDARYDLMPGLFDAALNWPLTSEIYSDRAMTAMRLDGTHSRYSQEQYEAEFPHLKEEV
jgi:hypothetical protein